MILENFCYDVEKIRIAERTSGMKINREKKLSSQRSNNLDLKVRSERIEFGVFWELCQFQRF